MNLEMPSCHCRRTRTRASHARCCGRQISPRVPHAHEKLNWEKEEKGRNGIKVLARRACPDRRRRRPRCGSEMEGKPSESCGDGSSKPGNRIDKGSWPSHPRKSPAPEGVLSIGLVGYCWSANGRLLLQQSAMINHAPSRRHTFTYFPRSATVVPLA